MPGVAYGDVYTQFVHSLYAARMNVHNRGVATVLYRYIYPPEIPPKVRPTKRFYGVKLTSEWLLNFLHFRLVISVLEIPNKLTRVP